MQLIFWRVLVMGSIKNMLLISNIEDNQSLLHQVYLDLQECYEEM